jgi:hypothetical protein
MKTVLVERGIVTIQQDGTIRVGPATSNPKTGYSLPKPYTLSEEEFYSRLEEKAPGVSTRLKAFLNRLEDFGIKPEYRRSVILRWNPTPDVDGSLGYVDAWNCYYPGDARSTAADAGCEDAGRLYVETVAKLVGGSVDWRTSGQVVTRGSDGKTLKASDLLDRENGWIDAISNLVSDIEAKKRDRTS